MCLRLIFTLATALTWASCLAASENAPTTRAEVRASSRILASYTRPAVDHVVTYAVSRRFGPGDGDRITIWRHGQLIREMVVPAKRPGSPAKITTFSNFATGAFAREFANADGSGQFHFARSEGSRFRIERTNEMRTIAGEQCRMWRTEQIDGGWAADAVHAACVTDDGVVLSDASLSTEGTVLEERTALKVERRPVAPAETMPPRDVLSWAAWQADVRGRPREVIGRPGNYDVQMKQKGGTVTRRYLASGGWLSTQTRSKEGKLLRFQLHDLSGAIWVESNEGGLIVTRGANVSWPLGKAINLKPGKVLGEQCHWFDTTPKNVFDYYRYECRAWDGLVLMIDEGQPESDPPRPETAFSASRRKTGLSELVPPRGMLSWTRWGWPELEAPSAEPRKGRAHRNPRPVL